MEARDIIGRLRELGLQLYVQDGVAHGRMAEGGRIPAGAWGLIDQLRAVNEQAVAILLEEGKAREPGEDGPDPPGVKTAVLNSIADIRAWRDRYQNASIRLIGKIIVCREPHMHAVLKYVEVADEKGHPLGTVDHERDHCRA